MTREELKNAIREALNEAIEEISINAKKRNLDNAVNVFKKGRGGYNGISHFGVLTSENPNSMELPRKENGKLLSDLKKSLKSAHYIWQDQIGHFGGNDEHSLFVFNISVNVLAYYSGRYEQTSFIYGKLIDGEVHSEYWEKQNVGEPYNPKTNPYIMKDSCNEWVDASSDEDYSVIGNSFKYTIPFSIFGGVNETINQNLMTLDEENRNGALNIALNGVGNNAWNYRGIIYKNLLK